jgi:hypothetical protein
MPAIATQLGVHFRSQERDMRGNKYDPLDKIAGLQKKLTGAPEDAELLLEQRAVYLECKNDHKAAQECVNKAEATLRPFLQSNDPRHGHLLALYGFVLEAMSESVWIDKLDNAGKQLKDAPTYDDKQLYPWAECEKLARKAVALSPNDWRTWAYLAHIRQLQIPTILCGGDDKKLSRQSRAQEAIGMLYLKSVAAALAADAERALDEAAQCHEKAKQLAPQDPKRQTQRYGFRLAEIMLRNAFARNRSEMKPPYPMQQLERTVLDELEIAAQLNPEHLLWQSQLVHQLIIVGWQNNPSKDKVGLGKFVAARKEDEQAIRAALVRIGRIADTSQGETAVFCCTMLAALHSSLQENDIVEKHARKVLTIDPKNQMAGEQLQQALLMQGRHADQLAAAYACQKASPTSRNCYLLAKAMAFNQQYDSAELKCLEGLKVNGADLYCLMGLAALTMRKSDAPEAIAAAGKYLELARRECRPEAGPLAQAELDYLLAVHQALNGEGIIARFKLEEMQRAYTDNPRYGKLLSAFQR